MRSYYWADAKVDEMDFVNGSLGGAVIDTIMGSNWARVQQVSGWTVSQLFQSGFPGHPGSRVNGFTPPTGNVSYLREGAVRWALLIHEALHKFGKDDTGMMLTLKASGIKGTQKIDPAGASSQITDQINEKCR